MNISRLASLKALLAPLLVLLAACGVAEASEPEVGSPAAVDDSGPNSTEEGGGDATAPAPEAIPLARVGLSGEISTLDPAAPRTANDYVPGMLVSGMLYRHDFERRPQFDLLEDDQVSDDGLTVTHTLKPELQYSDGTPVQAEDAVFALERLRDTPGAFLFERVESAEAPDDRTIIWHMSAPFPNFPEVLSQQYLWLHPREQLGENEDYFVNPVSAGPYMVEEWTPGSPTMRLTTNPNYWATPVVEAVEFSTILDLTSRVLQISQGQLDYVFDVPASAQESFPPEVRTFPHGLAGMYHLTTNLAQDGPLSDPQVRQAISLAIDRQAVSDIAFFGITTPACAFLYSNIPEHECMLPNDGEQDLEGARELLAETPYADGFTFELQVWARPGWPDAALVIAEDLAEIGITAEVTPLEDAVAVESLQSGNFQMQFSGNTGPPVQFLQNQFLPDTFWGDAARYDDPQVAELLQQASVEPDPDRLKELLVEAQLAAYEDLPHIPIADRAVLSASLLPEDTLEAVDPGEYIRVELLE
jgi:peptide/nickel transport system substrate-binding protein